MAYTPNTLSLLTPTVEGAFKQWAYQTADSFTATVVGSGYFSDGVTRGMQVGDMVISSNPTTPANSGIGQVTSVSGNAATITAWPNA